MSTGPRLFYTTEELREYCKQALQKFLGTSCTNDMTKYFKGQEIELRSFSNNSVRIRYYGKNIQFDYMVRRGIVQ